MYAPTCTHYHMVLPITLRTLNLLVIHTWSTFRLISDLTLLHTSDWILVSSKALYCKNISTFTGNYVHFSPTFKSSGLYTTNLGEWFPPPLSPSPLLYLLILFYYFTFWFIFLNLLLLQQSPWSGCSAPALHFFLTSTFLELTLGLPPTPLVHVLFL